LFVDPVAVVDYVIWQSFNEMLLFLQYGRDSKTLSTCTTSIAEVTISAQGKITHADKMPPIGSWMRLMRGTLSSVGDYFSVLTPTSPALFHPLPNHPDPLLAVLSSPPVSSLHLNFG
jgi:hypothetical protein